MSRYDFWTGFIVGSTIACVVIAVGLVLWEAA